MLLHFELAFVTGKPVEKMSEGDVYEGPKEFKRVVIADDHDTATLMAEAMLGEEISSTQVLEKVAGIRFTSQPATMGKFNDARDVWDSVLAKMNLEGRAIAVWDNDNYGYFEVVGFTRVKKVQ